MHISFFGAFVAAWFIGWLWRSRHNELLAAIRECQPPSRTRLMFEEYVRAGMTEAYDRGYEARRDEERVSSLDQICSAIRATDEPGLRANKRDRW